MKQSIFALIDCNNFFVSCERLFRPDLEDRPVVVLSSNDGCAIARSNEAKALGIPMGAPAFKFRRVFEEHKVVQFSANFELYGDISKRIIKLLTTITPRIEIYSIDEAFLDLSELDIVDYDEWGRQVCSLIKQWVGVPVSIGIAPTKTLAKLASDHAKRLPELGGALSLVSPGDKYLGMTPIQEVWGVGRRLAPQLQVQGVVTALDLKHLAPRRAGALMGLHGRQMVAELNGMSCLPLTLEDRLPQTISRTRTFGKDTNEVYVLEAAIASFATAASYTLRNSHQLCKQAGFFLTTDHNKPAYRSWSREVEFKVPTADSGEIMKALTAVLYKTHEYGVLYHRAGVWLQDFVPDDKLQTDLFGLVNVVRHGQAQTRMQAIDSLNKRYGKHKVHFAAEDLAPHHTCSNGSEQQSTTSGDSATVSLVPMGTTSQMSKPPAPAASRSSGRCPKCDGALAAKWQPNARLRSPRYVSSWQELPKISVR